MKNEAEAEIERRFLVARPLPELGQGGLIEQAYLATGMPNVRVRRKDGRYRQTVKGERPAGKYGRPEVEFDLDPDVGERLFQLAGERTIRKTRFEIGRWELDVFHDDLEGLLILEIELESEDEALPPLPAGVRVLREVTHEVRLGNAALAALGPEERRAFVEQLYRDVAR